MSRKVFDFVIKRSAEDLVNRLDLIAQSLDAIQKDKYSLRQISSKIQRAHLG